MSSALVVDVVDRRCRSSFVYNSKQRILTSMSSALVVDVVDRRCRSSFVYNSKQSIIFVSYQYFNINVSYSVHCHLLVLIFTR